jgi:pimeloyl-ACP methyl ester carboxylesterase
MVRRRHVFYVEGYDPQGFDGYIALFRREFRRFLKLWPLQATMSEPAVDPAAHAARWTITAAAPNWRVETSYEMMAWHDLAQADLAKPFLARLPGIVATYGSFLLSGALFRIFHASWRFGLFFIYPAVMMLLTLAVAAVVASALTDLLAGYGSGIARTAGAAIGIAVAIAAIPVLKQYFVLQLAQMWVFVRDQIKGRRPDFDRRVDDFATRIIARAKADDTDEIVIVGHSCGGLVAMLAASRALEREPALGTHGPTIVLMSLGSIMPAAALHPAGREVRRAIERLANTPSIAWLKFQSRKDVINVFKFDPVAALDIPLRGPRHNPTVVAVRFADCLEPKTYLRFRNNFFRMHFQFIMANDRRASYDYFFYLLGPAPVTDWPSGEWNLLARFGADASFTTSPDFSAQTAGPA